MFRVLLCIFDYLFIYILCFFLRWPSMADMMWKASYWLAFKCMCCRWLKRRASSSRGLWSTRIVSSGGRQSWPFWDAWSCATLRLEKWQTYCAFHQSLVCGSHFSLWTRSLYIDFTVTFFIYFFYMNIYCVWVIFLHPCLHFSVHFCFVLISFNWLSSISNFCFERKFVAIFLHTFLSASALLLLLLVQLKTSATWCEKSVLQSIFFALGCYQNFLRSSTRSSATASWETALTSTWCPSSFDSCWWSLGSSETRGLLSMRTLPFSWAASLFVWCWCAVWCQTIRAKGTCEDSVTDGCTVHANRALKPEYLGVFRLSAVVAVCPVLMETRVIWRCLHGDSAQGLQAVAIFCVAAAAAQDGKWGHYHWWWSRQAWFLLWSYSACASFLLLSFAIVCAENCKRGVGDIRAVIWFPVPVSSLVLLPHPVALSVLSFFF